MRKSFKQYTVEARRSFGRNVAKFGTAATAMVASGAALAGGSSPGAAIAGELAGGSADMGLVYAACAVLIGGLLLWFYVRRAAK